MEKKSCTGQNDLQTGIFLFSGNIYFFLLTLLTCDYGIINGALPQIFCDFT